MTTSCPNGHDSEWPDWCSVCGERLAAVPAGVGDPVQQVAPESTPVVATPPAPTGPVCENCGVARHEDDVFCESCGYDFASGSLPEGETADLTPMHAKISVDQDFFRASVGDVDLDLPDPLPEPQVVPLPGIRILIGRQSTSRGVFPEIDVQALTDDPAVSSRHAMLERNPEGDWTLTDLGSTNGTFLNADAEDAIESGVVIPVTPGMTMYLGAWTKVTIDETSA